MVGNGGRERWSWAWGFTCRAGWRTLFSRTLSQQASQVICWQRNFLIIHQAKISFSISDDVIFARNWKNLQAHGKGVSGTSHLPLAHSDVHVKYVATICCACACVAADDDECCTHALHWFAWQSEGMDGLTTGQLNFVPILLKSVYKKGKVTQWNVDVKWKLYIKYIILNYTEHLWNNSMFCVKPIRISLSNL